MVDESVAKSVSGEQTQQAFRADGSNFDASAVLHDFDQRYQAAIEEIGVFDDGPARVDHLAGWKLNLVALTQYLIANAARQR